MKTKFSAMTIESQKLAIIQTILALQDKALVDAMFKWLRQHDIAATNPPPHQAPAAPYRQFGFAKGLITYVAPDFDETPPGFEEYMPTPTT